MWSAKYSSIDLNGLSESVKVTIRYSNDSDDYFIDDNFLIPTEDVDSDSFRLSVQSKVDLLNKKYDFVIGKDIKTVNVLSLLGTVVLQPVTKVVTQVATQVP